MIDQLVLVMTCLSACGTGLIGGVFFAFSSFVMKALARLPPAQGIAAMQSINVVVINPAFLGVFLGTGVACAVLVVASVLAWREPAVWLRFVGSGLYLVGTILVTMVFNVPRNDALANVDPSSADAESIWREYIRTWTTWNHVRTVAALAAAGCFVGALMRIP